jgi:hypothetical protein
MSQLESKTKTIDGHTFEVSMLDPFDAQDILVDIGQAIAPALGGVAAGAAKLVSSKAGSLLDVDISDPEIASAITGLFKGIEKAKLRQLMLQLAEVTTYVGKQERVKLTQVYKVLFRGDLALMYRWFWFALTANFENFTGWAGDAISAVTGIVKAAQSQSTSKDTGQS